MDCNDIFRCSLFQFDIHVAHNKCKKKIDALED